MRHSEKLHLCVGAQCFEEQALQRLFGETRLRAADPFSRGDRQGDWPTQILRPLSGIPNGFRADGFPFGEKYRFLARNLGHATLSAILQYIATFPLALLYQYRFGDGHQLFCIDLFILTVFGDLAYKKCFILTHLYSLFSVVCDLFSVVCDLFCGLITFRAGRYSLKKVYIIYYLNSNLSDRYFI